MISVSNIDINHTLVLRADHLSPQENITIATLVLAIAAAWSMGHHYSGAVVGPAFGSKAIHMYPGILLVGILVVIGSLATRVISTYVSLASIGGIYEVVVLFSLVLMANVTTYLKVPVSTIQLYAFSVLGAAVATRSSINYYLFLILGIGWVASPILSYFLGKGIFKVLPTESKYFRYIIIGIMLYSGLVLGLNDVSNAASSLVGVGFDIILAKAICGISMYIGMLTWGSRLIRRVGEELIKMDYRKAVAAQLTKSVIVSSLNVFGLNASMNQSIVGALAGLGARRHVLNSILKGWIYSPLIGFATAYVLSLVILVLKI
jgi:inorganic phosphate transporter, PiT family